jgi:hypothetical protein
MACLPGTQLRPGLSAPTHMAIPGGHPLHHSPLLPAALDGGLHAVQVIWLAGRLGGGAVGGCGALGGARGGDTIGSALHGVHSVARGKAGALAHAARKVLVGAAAGKGQAGRAARAGTAFVADRGSGSGSGSSRQGQWQQSSAGAALHCIAHAHAAQSASQPASQPCPLRAACPPTHVRRPVSRM